MKKLMMMCVAAMAVCAAHAAAVQWNSGTLYMHDGTTKAGKDDITAYLWESTVATAFDGISAADLYAARDGSSSLGNAAKSVNSSALAAANLTTGTAYSSGTEVYSAVLYVNNTEGGYIANFAHVTAGTSKVTVSDVSVYEGGSFNGSHGNAIGGWTGGGSQPDVPEPTSALLLLMGGAMLALRRKQK